ncbi:hypothetical protein LZ30DRAFT_208555 [Colletotrichum cereale]|nr:hypothetical protein LZ30DRAFT_208555 [Colletotrichum cereale]
MHRIPPHRIALPHTVHALAPTTILDHTDGQTHMDGLDKQRWQTDDHITQQGTRPHLPPVDRRSVHNHISKSPGPVNVHAIRLPRYPGWHTTSYRRLASLSSQNLESPESPLDNIVEPGCLSGKGKRWGPRRPSVPPASPSYQTSRPGGGGGGSSIDQTHIPQPFPTGPSSSSPGLEDAETQRQGKPPR